MDVEISDGKSVETADHPRSLLQALNELRTDPNFCDVILCAENSEFPVHKVVLAASCPYFKAMFSCSLKESKEKKVNFSEMTPIILQNVVDYIYTGTVEVNNDNAQDLLSVAHLFQMSKLTDICCNYLLSQLHPTNCFDIELFAQMHSISDLEKEARLKTIYNFQAAMKSDSFHKISCDRLCSYLLLDEIEVESEEDLFEAVDSWLHHDTNLTQACKVLQLIRYKHLSSSFLNSKVLSNPHVSNCLECTSFINQQAQPLTNVFHNGSSCNFQISPRPSTLAQEVLIIFLQTEVMPFMISFFPEKKKWITFPTPPCRFSGAGVVSVDGNIFVTGGLMENYVLNEAWFFSRVHKSWTRLPSMSTSRAYHNMTSWDQKLYVMGGVSQVLGRPEDCGAADSIDMLDLKELFSPSSKKSFNWTQVATIPFPRINSTAVTYKGLIIEGGGTQFGVAVKKLETYKCPGSTFFESNGGKKEENHEAVKPFTPCGQYVLPDNLKEVKMVVCENLLYILWKETSQFISLDPVKRVFRKLKSPGIIESNCDMAAIKDKIFLVSSNSVGTCLRVYNKDLNSWSLSLNPVLPNMDIVRCVHSKLK